MGNEILHGSLFGYSKKDVNNYISELSNQYKVKNDEFIEQLLSLQADNEALKENEIKIKEEISLSQEEIERLKIENEELKNQNEELKNQISFLNKANDDISCMLDNLAIESKANEIDKNHFERLYSETMVVNTLKQKIIDENKEKLDEMTIEAYASRKTIDENNEQISTLNSQVEELIQELQQIKEDYSILLEEKEKTDEKYAKVEDEISFIIEKAQKNAEEIIADAKKKANEILDNAGVESDIIVTKANNEAERIKSVYKGAAQEYYSELMQYTDELKYSLAAFMKEVSIKSKDFNDKIDYMRLDTENKSRTTGVIEEKEPVKEVVSSQKEITEDKREKSERVNKIESKLEELFRKALNAINNLTNRKD